MSLHDELVDKLNIDYPASTLDRIEHPIVSDRDIKLFIKRDDKLHPIISGNKWRKLKYILSHAIELGFDHLISMGGAYSNHLHALAYTGHQLGLRTTGFIRGEQHPNPTLKDLQDWGMNCIYVNRSDYRKLRAFKQYDSYPAMTDNGYWIPEGAATAIALKGVAEIIDELPVVFDTITVACGTATTLAGLITQLPEHSKALGFSVLQNTGFLESELDTLNIDASNNWHINNQFHFGGFAKTSNELNRFIRDFSSQTKIEIEPVYTGKMLYGLFELIKQNYFTKQQTIIAYHSGGLQGARSTH